MSCVGGEWGGKGYVWESRDYATEYGVSVELVDVSSRQARVKIYSSFAPTSDEIIAKGENVTIGDGWTVHCDDVVESMVQAKIRICRDEEEEPPTPEEEIQIGEMVTVDGHTFQLLDLVCGTNARIVARVDGVLQSSKAVIIAGALLVQFPIVGIAVGGLYAGIKTLGGVCSLSLDRMAAGGLTRKDQEDNEERAADEYTNPDGTKPTPEEIKAADDEAEKRISTWTNSAYVEKVRQLTAGEITPSEFTKWLKDTTYNLKLVILEEKFYHGNFSLSVPSLVMAGDVDITGTAPQPNQMVKIMAVKKFMGFDWLAKDPELDSVSSDSDYKYKTTVLLDEFGSIEVYGMIGKDWWQVLDKDIETEKHTVLVVTPMILLALLAMLAMVLDKKYNFIGMFKKKRGKK